MRCCSAGFPKQTAAQIILASIRKYFSTAPTDGATARAAAGAGASGAGASAGAGSSLQQVYFVLYDTESINVYTSELGKLDQ